MKYLGTVIPATVKAIDEDVSIIDAFLQIVNETPTIQVPSDPKELSKLKKYKLVGLISGEMFGTKRNNANLLSRDCAIFDLDDVIISEPELRRRIDILLRDVDYVLYPSISNGFKGVRYRLLLPLGQSVTREQYEDLIEYFTLFYLKGIVGKPDISNFTWSQIQLLPVYTQFNKPGCIIISKGTKLFPTDEIIAKATAWRLDRDHGGASTSSPQLGRGGTRYRNSTTKLFESIVEGCEEGNRNNTITKIVGGLLARSVDVTAVKELAIVANSYFDKPLPDKELMATFYSIARKELGG